MAERSVSRNSPPTIAVNIMSPASPAVEAAAPPVSAEPDVPKLYGIPIRYLVLPLLTAQNASAVLLMRGVRSLPGQTEFSTLTAVIMQETFKMLACIAILLATDGTLSSAWNKPVEALKTVRAPSILHVA